ncbi:MAG TPA: DUF1295 domain-containing protein [Bacteroidetes bacterium]|nr:DUF1295 domain-containing protein [Bacteroidota bacterium]
MDIYLFTRLVVCWALFAVLLFPLLLKVTAPYGRHATMKWGPVMNNRAAWVIMEAPALLVFVFVFLTGNGQKNTLNLVFFLAWVVHYTHRSFVYPFRIRNHRRKMPVVVMLMAFFFNLVNGFLNGWYLGNAAAYAFPGWLFDVRFLAGAALFAGGLSLNWWADNRLLKLRKVLQPGEYIIPRGGMYRYVSCPNFLGEIVEWGGFALMTWSPAALSFFVWTVVNLLPRALDHHRWYRRKFADYPSDRKALVPFVL